MNSNSSRKMVYAIAIVLIFGVMFPYTRWLTVEKSRRDLGEAAIGQIDTGSFMMKLFLLGGFRGVAANILWLNAEEYKKEHDWDRLKSTVEWITKLQPHFLAIWTFQGWNLAYNVSVEWDAPEDKYTWIKEGIKFIQEGVSKNRKSPDLVWDTAWGYYHKLGFSDESIILRRLFRDDEDEAFRSYDDPAGTGQKLVSNDNFKLGFGWFKSAVNLVDRGAERLSSGTREMLTNISYVDPVPQRKGRSDDISFRSMPGHAQTRYAAALEKMSTYGIPATFGEVAQSEWSYAAKEWDEFGSHPFISFNTVERDGKMVRDWIQLIDACYPERLKKMPDNQAHWTNRWADQMNYRYWRERSKAEMTREGVLARKSFYEGTVAYKTGDFSTAAAKFLEGLKIWKTLLDEYPTYREDDLSKKETGLIVKRYVRVLAQLDPGANAIPKDVPFIDYLKLVDNDKTVDPFDVLEMIGVVGDSAGAPAGGPSPTAPPSAPAGSKK